MNSTDTDNTDTMVTLYRYYQPHCSDGEAPRFSSRGAAVAWAHEHLPGRTPHILTGLTEHPKTIRH